MDNEEKSLQKLESVLEDVDNWLISYGHIPAHAHDRIIEELSINVKGVMPSNIEYYVDPANRRVDVTVYFSLWKLIFMWLFGKRDKKLSKIISTVEGILVGYEIRAALARRKLYETSKMLPNASINADSDNESSQE